MVYSNTIILYYRPYSCGKFLSNILSFADNVVPQLETSINYRRFHDSILFLDTDKKFTPEQESFLKKYKIERIFQTIPSSNDECQQWFDYEMGCMQFWGFNANDLNLLNMNTIASAILNNNKRTFIVAHTARELDLLKTVFTKNPVIEVVNDDYVNLISLRLKNKALFQYPVNETKLDTIKFDIDCIFDKDKFFNNMEQLRTALDIGTLDDSVYEFYDKYIALYNDIRIKYDK